MLGRLQILQEKAREHIRQARAEAGLDPSPQKRVMPQGGSRVTKEQARELSAQSRARTQVPAVVQRQAQGASLGAGMVVRGEEKQKAEKKRHAEDDASDQAEKKKKKKKKGKKEKRQRDTGGSDSDRDTTKKIKSGGS